jgi:hypothetical protein
MSETLTQTHHFAFFYNPSKKKRPPCCEVKELASRFGVSPGQLHSAIRNAKSPFPEPTIVMGARKWYSIDAVTSWWNEVGCAEVARAASRVKYEPRHRMNVAEVTQS